MNDITEIFRVTLLYKTDRAYYLDYEGNAAWAPISVTEVLEGDTEVGQSLVVEIPNWLAIQKGWSEE